ncbi:MAG TPA: PQQ-dependent sugar dehydrogenase [Kofleriaceae bacterium]|jgi:glucose/arabinose dehydrogenase|nr:PQQ-dependent sugar dehydrogenase [Kofleriaceae bacterium]
MMGRTRNLVALTTVLIAACGESGKNDDIPTLPPCTTPVAGDTVMLRQIATLSDAALLVTAPAGDPRLFVVERAGRIRILENGVVRPMPFLDIEDVLVAGGEQGLLGLAFHPRYATTGRFFVFYTTNNANVVARCQVSATDPNLAEPTCTPILSIPDFAGNHNGGMIEFGSDGFLYIGTGDGGGGGDPQRTAQDLDNLLGKFLRIDVDGTTAGKLYGIPADNPYASGGGAPEVFIRGLRNPWRWSFDRMTHDLWIGDVGQGRIEELTVLRPAQQKGANLGWSIYEGMGCCDTQDDNCTQSGAQAACEPSGLVFPQDSRTHGDGWISIIAGQVYRGTCYPDLTGWFFYTDHSSEGAGLVKARLRSDDTLEIVDLPISMPAGAASIHADARGELYLTTIGGGIYEIGVSP